MEGEFSQNEEKSDSINDINEELDDVEITRGSIFQMKRYKVRQRLMMQVKYQKGALLTISMMTQVWIRVKDLSRWKREEIRHLKAVCQLKILEVKPGMIAQHR